MTDPSARRTDSASLVISAPPQRVFEAFATPESLMAWLPPAGMSGRALEYDLRSGGRYRLELRYEDAAGAGKTTARTDVTTGRFLRVDPPRRISQTVEFDSADPSFAGEMVMTWTFETEGAATRVTITAEHVPEGIRKADHDQGLRSSLENLARYLAREMPTAARRRSDGLA